MHKENPYWMTLAHLSGWKRLRKNECIFRFHCENGLGAEEFLRLGEARWKTEYGLDSAEINSLRTAEETLPQFLLEARTLSQEGIDIIPIISREYSQTLLMNMGRAYSPALLYFKGDKNLLQKHSVAIIGSRKASQRALAFTDNISRLASEAGKVIVSGYAKGVDQQALSSALMNKGKSIIVLPQGILTFGSGIRKFVKEIEAGDVGILSIFPPAAPWMTPFAMARNHIIYGLSNEIYIAETGESGGTWSGAIDGLRKKRVIHIRRPKPQEDNANALLIEKGAVPVDYNGSPVKMYETADKESFVPELAEPTASYETAVLELLKKGEYTTKEIQEKLQLEISTKKLLDFLKNHSNVQTINKRPLRFKAKGDKFDVL
ncbi:MAG: DNA-processing protein DprA [Bacteroidetes bacterium]|nr:DNA-processing protein DprA [Bacteroidota bacterium]